MEVNELNKNAKGGTELVHLALESKIRPDLLSKVQLIPSRVRDIDPNRTPILVLHDLPSDPESEHLRAVDSQDRFGAIVCVSHWQANLYNLMLNVPFGKMTVLQNAIEPIEYLPKRKDGPIRLIYHTTPHRGLGLLLAAFDHLSKLYDDIELDVYSSFSIYGWSERDAQFEELFAMCREHPKIRYHGAVPNAEVRQALTEADIFAYPSIWPETSCIAAIEALVAGCVMVSSSYAALPETAANFAVMYPFTEVGQEHLNRFASTLASTIENVRANRGTDRYNKRMAAQSDYFNNFYSWDYRIPQWNMLIERITS